MIQDKSLMMIVRGVVLGTQGKALLITGFFVLLVLVTLSVLFSENGEGREIVVDENGGGDYLGIRDALNVALEGDTITLRSGNYAADYLVGSFRENLTIRGNDSKTTRLSFAIRFSDLIVRGSNVTFSGINFTSNSPASSYFGTTILAYNGTGITFRQCIFHQISRVGIYYSAFNTTFKNNSFINSDIHMYTSSVEHALSTTFSNNTFNGRSIHFFKNQNDPTIPSDHGGLLFVNCTNVTVRNWNGSHLSLGMRSFNSTRILIENCTVNAIGGSFNFFGNSDITVSDCTILPGPYMTFFYAMYNDDATFSNNTFFETIYLIGGDRHHIEGNIFRGESHIMFYPVTNTSIIRNSFETPGIQLIPSGNFEPFGGTSIVIEGNSIDGNPIHFYQNERDIVVPDDTA